MKRPTLKELDAIIRLRNDADFQVVFNWLAESCAEETKGSIKIPTEPQRTWSQGKAQALEILIETIQKAPQTYEAMKANEGGQ